MLLTDAQLKLLLSHSGLVSEKTLADTATVATISNISFSDALIEKGVITDEKLGQLVASFLGLPFVTLTKISIPEDIFYIIPERLARKQKVIVFARDASGIKIAMADPRQRDIQEMVSRKTGEPIVVYYATERDIDNTLRIYRRNMQKIFDKILKEESQTSKDKPFQNAPIAKIIDLLITYAYSDKASDIHIEPQETDSLIRFRIDGILHDVTYLPKTLHDQLITRIKVQSQLRTDEHLSPQDGKMQLHLEEENLDIRVSIIPIVEGEKAVLRLLPAKHRQITFTDLGMNQKDLAKIENAYNKSYGMILSTGPTGSGKTTFIYAILKILNTREKNITTIEDPVEYRIKGLNQIQVNTKTNLTFASGLRSILRQDPNIVFVGEIRDNETAAIAVNAALTGHLVLSTLHTNDAATTLPRLTDMKVEPFLVSSTVNVIIAQRLVRQICEICKTPVNLAITDIDKHIPANLITKYFGNNPIAQVYKGKGCRSCHQTGYAGRVGVFEVLEVSKNIRKLIIEKNDSDVIAQAAIAEGMTTMLEDGLDKVVKGLTTMEEVMRVTKVETL